MKTNLLFFLLLPTLLVSQEPIYTETALIKTIVSYRNKLLLENINGTDSLRVLEQNWMEIDPSDEDFGRIAFNLVAMHNLMYSTKYMLKAVQSEYEGQQIAEKLGEQEINIIIENSELLALIIEEVLKPEFPYSIYAASPIFQEIEFYDIRKGDRVAEIGAGIGTFSILLGMLSQDIYISINELHWTYLESIKKKILSNRGYLDPSKFEVIEGKKKSTKLAPGQFDKIIIRNAFHHFKKKEHMLASISESLKEDGKLLLNEPVLHEEGKGNSCSLVMEREALLDVIQSNGFVLESEEKNGYWLLLRFGKK